MNRFLKSVKKTTLDYDSAENKQEFQQMWKGETKISIISMISAMLYKSLLDFKNWKGLLSSFLIPIGVIVLGCWVISNQLSPPSLYDEYVFDANCGSFAQK